MKELWFIATTVANVVFETFRQIRRKPTSQESYDMNQVIKDMEGHRVEAYKLTHDVEADDVITRRDVPVTKTGAEATAGLREKTY